MKLKVLGITKDLRTGAAIIYVHASIGDYLELVGEDFDDFSIQRKREIHTKYYQRMKNDLKNGTLLPTITLAVKHHYVEELLRIISLDSREFDNFGLLKYDQNDIALIEQFISRPEMVNILDGLQRTFILNDLVNEGHVFMDGQNLLLEYWVERELKNLIYRLIVLNAGQKPMSMRHQLELLFSTVHKKLTSDINGLQILLEKEKSRRSNPGQFPLERIVSAYQCYLTKTPEIEKQNLIAQELNEQSMFDADEDFFEESFLSFEEYLRIYILMDVEISRIYKGGRKVPPNSGNWLAEENVIRSFFAALARFKDKRHGETRVATSLKNLLILLENSPKGADPLALVEFNRIREGINPRKVNIGFGTRRLLTDGFTEFIKEDGEATFKDCWIRGSE